MTVYLGVIGAWVFSDGLYSILLYTGKPAYHGPRQTWMRDHWIRLVRMALGLVLVAFACLGEA
jgi:hypothetical protein